MEGLVLALVAAACIIAAAVWARSARRAERVLQRVQKEFGDDSDALVVARAAFRKEVHTTLLYSVLALDLALVALSDDRPTVVVFALILVPVVVSVVSSRDFIGESRLAEDRFAIERRAEEILSQDQLAPHRWAARLAPDELTPIPGFEVGKVFKAGTGLMAGDFYDVFQLSPTRVAAVIGDVTGHGIEPSITALQAKYLLRVFLRQFRDPAQAMEELNAQMSALEPSEEFISLVVVVFDTEAETMRYTSAGHPASWLWHEREVRPLRATGPLLMLDPNSSYISRELPLDAGDLVVLYTDGLAEARDGDSFFGEERVANTMRRDPGIDAQVLCKSLLEAAKDFASSPLTDDVAIIAIRRT
jgi:serine phosphatase RsbU (regulator of sigma subunit)